MSVRLRRAPEEITEPGIYLSLPEAAYHSDARVHPDFGPSFSQSGAKTLLASPIRFAYQMEHGRPPKSAFDKGTVVHAIALRSNDTRLRVVDARDWRTKVAQQAQEDAYKHGLVPVHRGQFAQAARVAQAVRRHPLVAPMLKVGHPEVSMYWRDPDTGVLCRARIDWLHPRSLVDLKSTTNGVGYDLDTFGRAAAKYDYPMQAAAYIEGFRVLTGEQRPFTTVTVDMTAPHVVKVGRYAASTLARGLERWKAAQTIFADRMTRGDWSESLSIDTIPVPGWYGMDTPDLSEEDEIA